MYWNEKKRNIHKIIIFILILFLICQYFFMVFSIRNNQGSFDAIRTEGTVCTGADYVSFMDDQVYVLNRLSQVLIYDENGNTFVSDGFRTKLYMIKADGTKKLLMEETWKDYLFYSPVLKVIAVFLIILNMVVWLAQKLRMRRRYNKKMRIKADPVRIMEEIEKNQEEIIWQRTAQSKGKMTFYFVTDRQVIKCIKGREFYQLFYDDFHHASIISIKDGLFPQKDRKIIVFAKHEPGYKILTYGEFGDLHEMSFEDLSDVELIVKMINQQREKFLQKHSKGAEYEENQN
ncbi:MAG: hypothetical protein Q4D45_03250 [Lachnospiraceae bacterium]|nr:hypothetical protein [Lachnospiraceae bacterium]